MIKNLKKILLTVVASSALLVPALVPAVALAQVDTTNLCSGANLNVTSGSGCDTTGATSSVNNLLTTILNIFSIVVGVTAVIFIILGGLKYITSGGEAANITGAKNTILFAIVGLVIVAFAQVIVKFVLGKVSTQ